MGPEIDGVARIHNRRDLDLNRSGRDVVRLLGLPQPPADVRDTFWGTVLDGFNEFAWERLRPYRLGPVVSTVNVTDVWAALGPKARRALVCLEILSDRRCGLKPNWRGGHLLRPGGLSEADIGWVAKAKTRSARREVCEKLEKLGAIRRVKKSPKNSRFFPVVPTSMAERLRRGEAVRASMHEDIRSIGRLALACARGRPRPGSPTGWRHLTLAKGRDAFVIGPPPPPLVLRYFERKLTGISTAFARLGHERPGEELAFRRWKVRTDLMRTNELEANAALIVPLA